jgi:hypothetical protein
VVEAPLIAFIRRCALGSPVGDTLPAPAAAIVARYAPVAVLINDFYWQLFGEASPRDGCGRGRGVACRGTPVACDSDTGTGYRRGLSTSDPTIDLAPRYPLPVSLSHRHLCWRRSST